MRRLTDWLALTIAGTRIRDEVDRTAGELVIAAAQGDDTALVGLADRLEELGLERLADRVRRLE